MTTHIPVPEDPWPESPSMEIRCNTCQALRRFEDRHRVGPSAELEVGPPCRICGLRLELRCSVCGSLWRPLS